MKTTCRCWSELACQGTQGLIEPEVCAVSVCVYRSLDGSVPASASHNQTFEYVHKASLTEMPNFGDSNTAHPCGSLASRS